MIKCCLNIPQCLWIILQYNRLKYYKDVSNIVCHKFNPTIILILQLKSFISFKLLINFNTIFRLSDISRSVSFYIHILEISRF